MRWPVVHFGWQMLLDVSHTWQKSFSGFCDAMQCKWMHFLSGAKDMLTFGPAGVMNSVYTIGAKYGIKCCLSLYLGRSAFLCRQDAGSKALLESGIFNILTASKNK